MKTIIAATVIALATASTGAAAYGGKLTGTGPKVIPGAKPAGHLNDIKGAWGQADRQKLAATAKTAKRGLNH